MQLDETQLKAVEEAVTNQFTVITGGAGTGKTTIIKAINDELTRQGKKVSMCAFAGKAAARLKEATKKEASTIHRMLGYMGTAFTKETLKHDCVIVDEASMVDSELPSLFLSVMPRNYHQWARASRFTISLRYVPTR
jgi:exodeoxyribonuclease V alpha subunit